MCETFIIGASVRAAVSSAQRAGVDVLAADLFADVDLSRTSTSFQIDDYPSQFTEVVAASSATSSIYTGGLENHPSLIEELARRVRVLGNDAATLRRVRNPDQIVAAFTAGSIEHPAIAWDAHDVDERQWLMKSRQSAGGSGVHAWVPSQKLTENSYLQQRVTGRSCSAAYVASNGQCRLLGTSEQIIGRSWTGAKSFQYAGSIGPLRLSTTLLEQVRRVGDCLARRFDLVGLFGVDFVIDETTAWPIEVNPRYTASMEVIECATGVKTIEWHVAACGGKLMSDSIPTAESIVGKTIVFADRDVVVSQQFVDEALSQELIVGWPKLTDIPHAGSHISKGNPICSSWAVGASEKDVEHDLLDRTHVVRDKLNIW